MASLARPFRFPYPFFGVGSQALYHDRFDLRVIPRPLSPNRMHLYIRYESNETNESFDSLPKPFLEHNLQHDTLCGSPWNSPFQQAGLSLAKEV